MPRVARSKSAAAPKTSGPPRTRGAKASASPVVSSAAVALPEVNRERAVALALDLMRIRGRSCHEGAVVAFIRQQLLQAGVPAECICEDDVTLRSPAGGEVGNLIVKLPGTIRGPRRLLMAHLDTVPVCEGAQPVLVDEDYVSGDPTTGLGADNRSGVAVVLATALEIFEQQLPHPPLTLFWPVQEELGMYGARFVRQSLLGKPKLAFNWDAFGAHRITLAATGSYAINIKIHGIASHAGGAPECGVSAIAIAGLAIHQLVTTGWHGDIQRGKLHGTSNLGIIKGGEATNVVADLVEIHAEARSHDARFRKQILHQIEQAFHHAAKQLCNDERQRGRVEIQTEIDYESFHLADDEPSVVAAAKAIRSLGLEPELLTSNGGYDANWMNSHGIPTVTLGAGQARIHTVNEVFDPEQFFRACRIALRIATDRT